MVVSIGIAELTFKIHTSLDGFVGRRDGNLSWLNASFEDQELAAWEVDLVWHADLHLMGRVLYDDMAAYRPHSKDVYAEPMNQIPKAVLSQHTTSAPWADDNMVGGDLPKVVNELKAASGVGVLLHGGASTGRALARLGLIDRWVLVQHPVALGEGLPIFGAEQALRLEQTKVFPSSARWR